MIGTTLNHYQIIASIGAGGMGEVFRARDTQLGREVAVKVMPKDFAADAVRLRRFEQEAKALAALNHPNVLTVHDAGVQDGKPFLVSELLEGKTLREEMRGATIPVRKAVEYALQIALGMAAAHGRGVIHRDLKPDNVFVTRDGRVKILDFGLAKLQPFIVPGSPAPGSADPDAPTLAQPHPTEATQPGQVMGTPSYMAPEQVRGEPVDHRADIFSFGVILYEMLSGRRPFGRNTAAESMSAVLMEAPPELSATNPDIPIPLARVVERCLEKQADNRFQSAKDLAFAIETSAMPSTASLQALREVGARPRRPFPWVAALGAASLLALGVGIAIGRWPTHSIGPQPTIRLSLDPSEGYRLTTLADSFAVSPDGRLVAIAEAGRTYRVSIRPLGSLESRPLPDVDGAKNLFWSPDSRFIGFFDGNNLKTVSIEGGRPTTLCVGRGAGGTWNSRGVIVFSEFFGGGLFRIPAGGGEKEPVTELDSARGEDSHLTPRFLPDGNHFLFLASIRREKSVIKLGSLDSKQSKDILPADALVGYAPPGVILFMRDGALYGHSFKADTFTLEGEKFLVADPVANNGIDSMAYASVSQNGVLAYRSEVREASQLTWFDRSGRPVARIGPVGFYSDFGYSPTNGMVAVSKWDHKTGVPQVWLVDGKSGADYPLVSARATPYGLTWSPDGQEVVWGSDKLTGAFDLYLRSLDRSKPVRLLIKSDNDKRATDWSADGRWLLFTDLDAKTAGDIWVLSVGELTARPLIKTDAHEDVATFSGDGRWVAYSSDESGRRQVYVQSFPSGGIRIPVSRDGGNFPVWSRKQGELRLFFLGADQSMMTVSLRAEATGLGVGEAERLFQAPGLVDSVRKGYAVSEDGNRFLFNVAVPNPKTQLITVVLNWPGDLKKR